MAKLSKPWNKKRLKRTVAAALAVAAILGVLYYSLTCEEWVGVLPSGLPGTTQTCKCHGWQAMLYDQMSMDGPRKYICLGTTYTLPGVAAEDTDPPADGATDSAQ